LCTWSKWRFVIGTHGAGIVDEKPEREEMKVRGMNGVQEKEKSVARQCCAPTTTNRHFRHG
jgi:hypothetical protein